MSIHLAESEKQVLLLLAQKNKAINLVKLTKKSRIFPEDLLNILQSLTRRGLIKNQDDFYQLVPVLREYF